ncbi:hypothetical protein B0O99DRAFT_606301 [Bisporella sp. PMI_857]|nr:hypothetical protein B0O99DRAFT_606301 [Bisporella sp. PMI_857]
MSTQKPLVGGCSCGRNRYTITIPQNIPIRDSAEIFFSSNLSLKTPHHPLTLYLHLPLDWLHSSTHSLTFDPFETHSQIRRSYTPTPSSQHYFCGFCGTHLTYWTENPKEEKEYINLAVGSLGLEGLRELDSLGLLPSSDDEEEEDDEDGGAQLDVSEVEQTRGLGQGAPWFDSLVSGSRLSRTVQAGNRRTTSSRQSGPGWHVEWEITEWVDDEDEPDAEGRAGTSGNGAKRKIGEVEDAGMDG